MLYRATQTIHRMPGWAECVRALAKPKSGTPTKCAPASLPIPCGTSVRRRGICICREPRAQGRSIMEFRLDPSVLLSSGPRLFVDVPSLGASQAHSLWSLLPPLRRFLIVHHRCSDTSRVYPCHAPWAPVLRNASTRSPGYGNSQRAAARNAHSTPASSGRAACVSDGVRASWPLCPAQRAARTWSGAQWGGRGR